MTLETDINNPILGELYGDSSYTEKYRQIRRRAFIYVHLLPTSSTKQFTLLELHDALACSFGNEHTSIEDFNKLWDAVLSLVDDRILVEVTYQGQVTIGTVGSKTNGGAT